MNFLKKYYGLILVLFLSSWAISSLFVRGFFPMHDNTQVARVYEMGKALKDGMFPVRWSQDLGYGYGYPVFNYYAPLAYYFGGIFTLFADALTATKIMIGLGIILSGISMYFLAMEFWGEAGAIISSLLYVYAPYHAVDIYVRGDVAEFWAYAFIPLIFYGVIKIYKNPKWQYTAITSLSYAALILSHNLSAIMVTPFFLVAVLIYGYLAIKNKKKKTVYYLITSVALGLLVSAFYWLPVFPEMKYTNVLSQLTGGANYKDNFVCFSQLWNSPWGFGGSIPGCNDGLSFRIGKLHVVILFVSLILFIFSFKNIKEDKNKFVIFSFLGFVVSVLLTLQLSQPLWQAISLMAFLQYPWRFLVLTSFFSSFIAGLSVWFFKGKLKIIAVFVMLGIGFYLYPKLFVPQTILNKNVTAYTSSYELKWVVSNITNEYMPKGFIKPKNANDVAGSRFVVEGKTANITDLVDRTQTISATINVPKKANLRLNLAYFPAWKIYLDNSPVSYVNSKQSVLLTLSAGTHILSANFTQTLVEKLADVLSLVGIAALILGIIFQWRKKY